jgi:hypothetical protein
VNLVIAFVEIVAVVRCDEPKVVAFREGRKSLVDYFLLVQARINHFKEDVFAPKRLNELLGAQIGEARVSL